VHSARTMVTAPRQPRISAGSWCGEPELGSERQFTFVGAGRLRTHLSQSCEHVDFLQRPSEQPLSITQVTNTLLFLWFVGLGPEAGHNSAHGGGEGERRFCDSVAPRFGIGERFSSQGCVMEAAVAQVRHSVAHDGEIRRLQSASFGEHHTAPEAQRGS